MATHRILITGGAGFIGCNAARRFLEKKWNVTIWDNLSRRGGMSNLDWLKQFGPFDFQEVDLRNRDQIQGRFPSDGFDCVLHCAGQVAVTWSVQNPREDLEINILGTFNMLEQLRHRSPGTFFINASTNKVYGNLPGARVIEKNGRHALADLPQGVPETFPLEFHSPYGCSKGAAEQYVVDYSRIYGVPAVSFRQSCIYGTRQFGLEDQGWVAWFAIAHALKKPVTLFGDGRQVRDILFVDDLVDAYEAAWLARDVVAGEVFNIGGGPANTLSLLELIAILKEIRGWDLPHDFADWRPGDQKVFVADVAKAHRSFGWKPKTGVRQGIENLVRWVDGNLPLFEG